MAEVAYTDIPDTQRQHIKDTVAKIREYMTPTLDSFKKSNRTVVGGQRGYQIAFFDSDYGQNSYLTPGTPSGTSFQQPIAPTTLSMWVGLSYQAAALYTDGILLGDLTQKESIIKETRLREMRMENFLKHQNYYSIGDRSGALAFVASVTGAGGAGTFTGTTAAQTTPGQTKGAHRLIKNVVYDIVDEVSFAVVGTITPTANGNNSATVAVTSTGLPNNAGALVVEQGAYNKVPAGLGYLIQNANHIFQGIDTADNKNFNSSTVDLNGSALTSATINTLKTKVQIRVNADSQAMGQVGHLTPGLYNTLSIQGFGARQYQANDGKADTSYGYPTKYVDADTMWVLDSDMDEDRAYLRRAGDYFCFEQRPLGPVDRDGLTVRQAPGDNNVGADAWFSQIAWYWNLGFDGDLTGGNYGSAYISRALVTNSQVNSV